MEEQDLEDLEVMLIKMKVINFSNDQPTGRVVCRLVILVFCEGEVSLYRMVKTTTITVTAVKQCRPLRVADLVVVGLNISDTAF